MTTWIFIDSRVRDSESLLAGLGTDVRVIALDPARDGVAQIAEALAGAADVDAIHVVSHGASGTLYLGSTILTGDNLDAYRGELSRIGGALTATGDILLYGCDVGSGAGGASFIGQLARYTGADVAASTGPTGASALGGDWDLEANAGTVEAVSLFAGRTGYETLLAAPALTPSGQLDNAFGGFGHTNITFGAGGNYGRSVAIQADGKIVVAGYLDTTNDDFVVARFNANGTLDNTFDGDGKVTTAIGAGNDRAFDVAIQADGKIVVAGFSAGANNDFALVRYNTNGSPDTTFGGDGEVTTPIGPNNDAGFAVAIQANGRIVVAGASFNGANDDFALARYNANGALDTTFSGDGKLTLPVGPGHDDANSIAIQTDGRIVVAGVSSNGTNDDFVLARFNADGSLDTTFGGGDGVVVTPIGAGTDAGQSVAIQGDGKILVAGYSDNGANIDFALVRYNVDGTLDASFSGDGKVTTAIGASDDFGRSVAVLADGRILVAGDTYSGVTAGKDFAFVRYNSDGSLDATFSGDGMQAIDLGESFIEQAYDVVIQQDGMIVVAGISGTDLVVARVIAGDIPDQNAPVNSAFSFTFPANVFTDPDGGTLAFSAALAGGGALPAWLSFDAGARTFSGTPGTADQGLVDIRVTASDGVLSASDVYTLKVGTFGTAGRNSITGGSVDDLLDGLGGNDTLSGGAGNDTLVGGAGVDSMVGGAGDDTYFVDVAADKVVETSNGPSALLATMALLEGITDTVIAAVNFSLANLAFVENLTLDGAATMATGNGLANVLTGNAANNTLNGGAGNDTMAGGAGNDTYIVGQAGDVVTELASEGTDTVKSSVTFTLGANIEKLILTGTGDINGTGNTQGNILTGNSGNNVLDGKGGADTLNGMDGNDTLVWQAADKLFDGGTGTDTLKVTGGNLNLTTIANSKIVNVEVINLTNSSNNLLTLNKADVLDFSSSTNTLKVLGDAGDSINIVGSFTDQGLAGAFHKYTLGSGAVLLVDTDITNVF